MVGHDLPRLDDGQKIRTASGKRINDLSSEVLARAILEQNDNYSDELPVAVVIASVLEDSLQKEMTGIAWESCQTYIIPTSKISSAI